MNKIWNWIKNIFKPERQDPPVVLHKEVEKKPEHCSGHLRFKKSCLLCQEIIK